MRKHSIILFALTIRVEEGFDVSPDEDERAALQGLRTVSQAVAEDDSFDVLTEHHKRNRAPRAPRQQNLLPPRAPTSTVVSRRESDESTNDESDSNTTKNGRVKRHSRVPYTERIPQPTQLKFYPSQWREVLENAKNNYRLFLVGTYPWPERTKDLKECADCLTEALTRHEEDDREVKEGKNLSDRYL